MKSARGDFITIHSKAPRIDIRCIVRLWQGKIVSMRVSSAKTARLEQAQAAKSGVAWESSSYRRVNYKVAADKQRDRRRNGGRNKSGNERLFGGRENVSCVDSNGPSADGIRICGCALRAFSGIAAST